jgi:hypothetical protein
MQIATLTEMASGTLLEAMLPRAVSLVGQFIEADLAGVARLADGGVSLKLSIAPTRVPGQNPWVESSPLNPNHSANGYALENGLPMVVSDLGTEQRFEDPFLRGLEVARAMIVPILVSGKAIGTLGAYWTQPQTLLPEDVQAAEAIARLLAAGISRARIGKGENQDYGQGVVESADGQSRDDCPAPPAIEIDGLAAALAADVDNKSPSGAGDSPSKPVGKNRRRSVRKPFNKLQWIAPLYRGVLPTLQQFYQVECCDLSNGGVSLYVTSSPQFDSVVIGLGEPPDMKYFSARVVRVQPMQHNGREVYQLGCQFMGRIHL